MVHHGTLSRKTGLKIKLQRHSHLASFYIPVGGEIQALPYQGLFATYSGDSYAVSIGPNKKVSKKIIEGLKKHFWVDRYTRALFTEANIYNANTNLLMIVTILHEIIPTGGWNFW